MRLMWPPHSCHTSVARRGEASYHSYLHRLLKWNTLSDLSRAWGYSALARLVARLAGHISAWLAMRRVASILTSWLSLVLIYNWQFSYPSKYGSPMKKSLVSQRNRHEYEELDEQMHVLLFRMILFRHWKLALLGPLQQKRREWKGRNKRGPASHSIMLYT